VKHRNLGINVTSRGDRRTIKTVKLYNNYKTTYWFKLLRWIWISIFLIKCWAVIVTSPCKYPAWSRSFCLRNFKSKHSPQYYFLTILKSCFHFCHYLTLSRRFAISSRPDNAFLVFLEKLIICYDLIQLAWFEKNMMLRKPVESMHFPILL
jgi:hypothetical protein